MQTCSCSRSATILASKKRNLLLYPLAALYRAAYVTHHRLCLRPGRPTSHAQVVIVGAYRNGGAGKTPFCIWLANKLCDQGKKVAVLCHAAAKDEAELLQNKLPRCTVLATRNRYTAAHKLDPDFDIILCDDGFEDSRLQFAKAICLEWGDEPQGIADLFPAGRARSLAQDHKNIALRLNCAGTTPDVRFCIQQICNIQGHAPEAPATLVAGIGDPQRFFHDMEHIGLQIQKSIALRDHDTGIENIVSKLLAEGHNVITTEKDASRLSPNSAANAKLFVAVQTVNVTPEAEARIMALLR